MDLQATQSMKEKRSVLSKVTVAFCLVLTAALLISSLVAPTRAQSKNARLAAAVAAQL